MAKNCNIIGIAKEYFLRLQPPVEDCLCFEGQFCKELLHLFLMQIVNVSWIFEFFLGGGHTSFKKYAFAGFFFVNKKRNISRLAQSFPYRVTAQPVYESYLQS